MDTAQHADRLRALGDPAPARVIYLLCALGVADELLDGPRTTSELAAAVDADPDALARVLRAAALLEVVAEDGTDKWVLCPAGRLLSGSVEGSMRAEFADNDVYTLWTGVLHSVRTGQPCYDKVFGASLFDRLAQRPAERASFHRHMHDRAYQMYPPLLGLPVWPDDGVLVDVAGGTGGLLAQLVADRPGLTGVLHDLPEVLALTDPALAAKIELAPGDVFTEALPAGDTYVLASVLHDWPDDRAAEILTACHNVGSRLLVVDRILPVGRPHPGFFNDLLMLAACGGRERTRADWTRLLGRTGFRLVEVHEAAGTELAVLDCVATRFDRNPTTRKRSAT